MFCFQMPPLGGIPQMINNVGRRKTGTPLSSRSGSGIEAPTRAFKVARGKQLQLEDIYLK